MIDIAPPRHVAEWIGKTPDQRPPQRVEHRLFFHQRGRCKNCKRPFGPAVAGSPQVDHIQALINGGENRESNMQLLCIGCHAPKTREDVAIKSEAYRVMSKHVGIRRKSSRPLPGSRNSRFRKKINGTVELR